MRRLLVSMLAGVLIALLVAGGGVLTRMVLVASYQPARCTITGKEARYDNGHTNPYTPTLTYTVRTAGGHQESVTGYKGPWIDNWTDRYLFADDADAVLRPYSVGESYQCWYSPLASPHAVLVLSNYSSESMNLSFWITLLIDGSVLGLVFAIAHLIWQQATLARRGISTRGALISMDVVEVGNKRSVTIITEFATRTDPPVIYHVMGNSWLIPPAVGMEVDVTYDPHDPGGNAFSGQRWKLIMFLIIFGILGSILFALCVVFVWLLWFQQ
jgi:hypothetical protein